MNKFVFLVLAAMAIVLLFCGCFYFRNGKNKMKASDLTYYHYKIYNGYSGISFEYEIVLKDSVVTATVRDCNLLTDSCKVYSANNVSREKLEEIGKMLVKSKVQNWESSYSNPDVFDGDNWSLSVKFGKDELWSNGYMAWPDNDPTDYINEIISDMCKPQNENVEP